MKKRLRNYLVILLLINISFLSLLYYISTIRFEAKKDNTEESMSTYYWFPNQHYLSNSIDLLSIDSTDNSQDYVKTIHIMCLTGPVIYAEVLLFGK